jgi:hypothetical protein
LIDYYPSGPSPFNCGFKIGTHLIILIDYYLTEISPEVVVLSNKRTIAFVRYRLSEKPEFEI